MVVRKTAAILAQITLAMLFGATLPTNYVRGDIVTFTDSTFADDDWQQIQFVGSSSDLASIQQMNGNPGGYRQTSVQAAIFPASGGWGAVHILNTARYDPSLEGEINSIDFSYDAIREIGPANGMYYSLAFRQDNLYFTNSTVFLPSTSWSSFSRSGLTAEQFILLGQGSARPNFSGSGGLLEFGYTTWSLFPSPTYVDLVGGVDNWQVTLNISPVPEPNSLALLVVAASFLGLRRARKLPSR